MAAVYESKRRGEIWSLGRSGSMLSLLGNHDNLPKTRFQPGQPPLSAESPGGFFFCLCHGSRFDLAGRVFDSSPAFVSLIESCRRRHSVRNNSPLLPVSWEARGYSVKLRIRP